VDETYIRVKGKWVYLYPAVDSTGATIDFLLSAKRDTAAAKRFPAKALGGANHPHPRVINTDKDAAYPPAIVQLKAEGALVENCRIDRLPSRVITLGSPWRLRALLKEGLGGGDVTRSTLGRIRRSCLVYQQRGRGTSIDRLP
jgi:IS6 family transposase